MLSNFWIDIFYSWEIMRFSALYQIGIFQQFLHHNFRLNGKIFDPDVFIEMIVQIHRNFFLNKFLGEKCLFFPVLFKILPKFSDVNFDDIGKKTHEHLSDYDQFLLKKKILR